MAFNELIKSFDHLRDYMRDFFVYGYKTRSDFERRSTRTYDNERRRIESYLGDYVKWEYGKNGKRLFLSLDSSRIPQNPLYQAYRSKSFTDNDILLHFFLLDLLEEAEPMTAGQIADEISLRYGESFDAQTVRGKLREYTAVGLLHAQKQKKSILYSKSGFDITSLFPDKNNAIDFLSFFGETAPFSVVGSYLSSRIALCNEHLLFKHHFLAHTLEDNILLPIAEAIRDQSLIEIVNFSVKSGTQSVVSGLPFVILVSVQTGRRYLILYTHRNKRYLSLRLDYIKAVKPLKPCENASAILDKGEQNLEIAWGASVTWRQETEYFSMTLRIDEEKEQYILGRLHREGRGGTVERIGPSKFRFFIHVSDTNELMNWVKTFTGRILAVEGDNRQVINRFYTDMRRMAELYGGDT